MTKRLPCCFRCGYDVERDKATQREHWDACRGVYTARLDCKLKVWHHHGQWCDECKGVA